MYVHTSKRQTSFNSQTTMRFRIQIRYLILSQLSDFRVLLKVEIKNIR